MKIKEIVNKAANLFELEVTNYGLISWNPNVILVRTANKGEVKVTFDNNENISIEYTSMNHIVEEYSRRI